MTHEDQIRPNLDETVERLMRLHDLCTGALSDPAAPSEDAELARGALEMGIYVALRSALQVAAQDETVSDEPGYLCYAWGESDRPIFAFARTPEEVGQFFCAEWFGEAPDEMHEVNREQYEEAMRMVRADENDPDSWDGGDSITFRFEIGGIEVTRAYERRVSPPPGTAVPATQKDQHGETQPQPRPDDQDITQAAEIDASAVGGTVRPGADQHHEHREGNTATDGAHAGANSRGAGVRAANQAASQTRLRDLTDEEIDAIHDSLPLVEIINAAGRERSLVMDAINRAFARAVVVAAGAAVPMEAETVQQDSLDAKRLETFRKTLLAYADSMYCKGIERMRTDPCLGWEHKVKTCQYGETELAAHAQANRDFGAHFGIYEAIKQADAAIAAQEKKS